MKFCIINFKTKNTWLIFAAVSLIIITATVLGIVLESFVTGSGALNTLVEPTKTVIIDPGHGGEDCGAIGCTGVLEKALNIDFSKTIGELLLTEGVNVVYTRTEDVMLYKPEENIKGMRKLSDLKSRVEISDKLPGAIFISIHMNSFGDEKYSGLQVYAKDKDESSATLAESIRKEVVSGCEPDNKREVKKGDKIYVLEKNTNTSVLIECGFLSNREECERLSQKEFQKELSFSIVCGIIKYMKEN